MGPKMEHPVPETQCNGFTGLSQTSPMSFYDGSVSVIYRLQSAVAPLDISPKKPSTGKESFRIVPSFASVSGQIHPRDPIALARPRIPLYLHVGVAFPLGPHAGPRDRVADGRRHRHVVHCRGLAEVDVFPRHGGVEGLMLMRQRLCKW